MSRSIYYLVLLLLLAGCAGAIPEPPTPTPQPLTEEATVTVATATTVQEAVPQETPEPSLPADPILAACRPEIQQIPFQDGLEPDLAALGLDACYELNFSLSATGESYAATAQVTLRNDTEDSWPNLLFRLYPESQRVFRGDIEVDRVTLSGTDVEWERTLEDETGLLLPLSTSLEPGDTVVVEIAFTGEPADITLNQEGQYGIFALGENTVTLASWFPLLAVWNEEENDWHDVPVQGEGDAVFSESALIEAALAAPDRFQLAVSGTILEQQSEDGLTTYEVVTGPARDLTMVWMDGYEVEEEMVDGTLLRNWYLPGHEAGADRALSAAVESLPIFNTHFGPYPFEELDIIEVPLAGAGGVEYPQLYLLDQGLYEEPDSHAFLAFASAHEMAHQWWYYLVGNDIIEAPWQDEALTNWSAIFWLEQAEGEEVAERYLLGYERSVAEFEEQEGEEPIAQPLTAFRDRGGAYGIIVYLKGTLFFQALREEIGDEPFFEALQAYYAENRFDIARPEELLAQFEETSGRSLDEFYREWGLTQ
ncbi:MAG: M1 family metallopeptidase [Chloroflexota bacterium]|nr:M1 family metallopeptidase [Chloroflexota bacterium]